MSASGSSPSSLRDVGETLGRSDDVGLRPGLAVAPGVLARVVDLEAVGVVLDGADPQPEPDELGHELLDQRGLARVALADHRHQRGAGVGSRDARGAVALPREVARDAILVHRVDAVKERVAGERHLGDAHLGKDVDDALLAAFEHAGHRPQAARSVDGKQRLVMAVDGRHRHVVTGKRRQHPCARRPVGKRDVDGQGEQRAVEAGERGGDAGQRRGSGPGVLEDLDVARARRRRRGRAAGPAPARRPQWERGRAGTRGCGAGGCGPRARGSACRRRRGGCRRRRATRRSSQGCRLERASSDPQSTSPACLHSCVSPSPRLPAAVPVLSRPRRGAVRAAVRRGRRALRRL